MSKIENAKHRPVVWRLGIVVCLVALGGLLVVRSREGIPTRVGPLPDGGFLLNSGWTIRPAGVQVPVDTFPMSSALSSNGKYLVVLNGGYNPPSISVIDVAAKKEIGRTPVPDGWLGLQFAPQSDRLFVGGGSRAAVYEFQLDAGTGGLASVRQFPIADTAKNGNTFIGDVAISPDSRFLYAADLYGDSIAALDIRSGKVVARWKCGRRPYRILVSPDGKELFVSSWADASVYQYDTSSGNEIARTRIGAHPTDMVLVTKPPPIETGEGSSYTGRLFVATANTNNVYSLGMTRDLQLNMLEAINVSTSPIHPLGMTPSALAVNRQGTQLYVVCSDANAIAVADTSGPRTAVKGFIPTGWYPTAISLLQGEELAVLSGKGLGSRANPDGPNPTRPNQPLYQGGPVVAPGYVAHIQIGSVGFVPKPTDEQLSGYTETVLRNAPMRDEDADVAIRNDKVARFARMNEHASPIQHVIYVIKENRTYDQVLGDLEKGNGDKSLNLFAERITPNLHQLAREFVLYDNFYENADVSADGHNWASAGIAPDYTMKMWPNEYGHRSKKYTFEGGEPANTPPAGYIWDNALQAGLTVRDYGQWTTSIPLKQVNGPRQIDKINDQALVGKVDMNYRGFDLEYSDVDRAHEFIREWKEFDASGSAPNFLIVRMGNDHTQGTKSGELTPFAYAADNDYGVGLLVDAVSHSKLWATTAIFIIEDDAQNGPDHVDSHRAPAWLISPYTHRGVVDSTMYNQTSILRTMELILGLRPMTHFDADATPMFGTFADAPDPKAFDAIPAKVSMTERNPAKAEGAAESARMDFSDADRIDDDELNAVLWRAIKHSDPPPPTRSAFAR